MHIIFLVLFLFFSISIVAFSLHVGISPMPSSLKAKQGIVSVIPINQKISNIYELGSGWGGLAFALAKAFPSLKLHAFEISPLPWLVSLFFKFINKYLTVDIYRENFFCANLENADVVVCYLYPKAMHMLKGKFENELKPGTWVISNSFTIPGWMPIKILQINDIWKSEIFVYQINHP